MEMEHRIRRLEDRAVNKDLPAGWTNAVDDRHLDLIGDYNLMQHDELDRSYTPAESATWRSFKGMA
jgi:hypothetical protein